MSDSENLSWLFNAAKDFCQREAMASPGRVNDAFEAAKEQIEAANLPDKINKGFEQAKEHCHRELVVMPGKIKDTFEAVKARVEAMEIPDQINKTIEEAKAHCQDTAAIAHQTNETTEVAKDQVEATDVPDKVTKAFEEAKERFGSAFSGLKDIKWEDVPEAAKERILNASVLDTTTIVAILIFFIPALIWAPAVLVLGVGPAGPMAGGVFAAMQSMFGSNAVMAVLQSAGMGGAWGVGILSGVTQGAAVMVGGFAQWIKNRKRVRGD